jgi:hypothetical protein
MRNLFLALILANVLFLAWHTWIEPSEPAPPVAGRGELAVFGPVSAVASAGRSGVQAGEACLRLGPLATDAALQQVRDQLAARGIDAEPLARESEQWLGHWVHISGFSSSADAESARQRLVESGISDAYLMQEGPESVISLGVFRDRDRADRLVGMAQNLGFQVRMTDRFRPAVEQWLLIRPRAGQSVGPADLSIAGDRIMRAEYVACGPDASSGEG